MARVVDLHGRVAVVTGAGSGIGRATALALARNGAKVHVADIDEGRAWNVASEIQDGGGVAQAHTLDVSDTHAVEEFAKAVFAVDDHVDIPHKTAGIGSGGDAGQPTTRG